MSRCKTSRREFTRTATAGALSLAATSLFGRTPTTPGLTAGAAETKITLPPVETFLIGPMKKSTGVHDDLFARALVLSLGEQRMAVVTLDFLGLDFSFNDLIVAEIERQTGIPRGNIMVNCSHTHNAPLTIPWNKWEKNLDKPWHKTMPGEIAAAVKQASARLRKARLRFGREPVQVGFNRRLQTEKGVVMRPNRKGTVVPWVDVLCVETCDRPGKEQTIAVLFSHAAHPVIVHAASTLISADYPGFAISTMKKQLGANGVIMFAQGCGANINGFPLQGGFDAAAAAGQKLGMAAVKVVQEKGRPVSCEKLQSVSTELTLPLRQPPPTEECRKLLATDPKNEYYGELLEIAKSKKGRGMRFPIRAFALGRKLCILGLPHEIFAEYQLFIEKTSPFKHNIVFAYTNGCEGYLGTKADYELGDRGGYETSPLRAPLQYHGRLAPQPNAETKVQESITKILQDLHGCFR